MCGFAVINSTEPIDPGLIERMADTLRHRGPDSGGFFRTPKLQMGFRRLSILDLSSAADQPLRSADGRYSLVFNGEIFNYIEVREELKARGYSFRSTGDTEVLLCAFQEWGMNCLQRLNGMWAFLVYDSQRHTLYGARDRLGIKPLYWMTDGDRTLFASEIKALEAGSRRPLRPNWSRLAGFLLQGRLESLRDSAQSLFDGVYQIEAGEAFEQSADRTMRRWRYWSIPMHDPESEPDDPVGEFSALFKDSVALRLRTDVPLAVSLSGGLDSNAILGQAAHLKQIGHDADPHGVHAFSYMPREHDETPYITAAIERAGAHLHPVELEVVDVPRLLEQVVRDHDEPVHSATALVGHRVYQTAREQGIKVMLTGQGADEPFAGYYAFVHDAWHDLLRRGRILRLRKEIADYAHTHDERSSKAWRALALRAAAELGSRLPGYAALRSLLPGGDEEPYGDWFDPDFRTLADPGQYALGSGPRSLENVLRFNVLESPLPLYLRIEDRNSMANSIEARVPFLDYRLVEFAFRLPAHWKIHRGLNKFVVREATTGLMPESVRLREDKMGFPTPAAAWLRGPLADPFAELLESRSFRERGIYDVDRISQAFDEHRSGRRDHSSQLFNIMQVEIWLESIVNRSSAGQAPARPAR